MGVVIVLVLTAFLLGVLVAWALCVAASDADDRAERFRR